MSCNRNGARIANLCAARSGIGRTASAVANASGVMLEQLETLNDRAGSTTAAALRRAGALAARVTPSPPVKAGLQLTVNAGTLAASYKYGAQALPTQVLGALSGNSMAVLKLSLSFIPHGWAIKYGLAGADFAGSRLAIGVARASHTGDVGETGLERRRLLLFKRTEKVKFWRSGLTPLLNRTDRLTRQVGRSHGLMFETGGRAWHLGVSQVKTSHGRQTLTHLQSLGMVGLQHYYFNRALSRAEAAGVASGQMPPQQLPGYVGQVSRVESLAPAWANVKHGLLKTQIHWPGLAEKAKP